MNLTQLREWLSWFPNNNNPEDKYGDKIKPFEPGKRLCERDYVIIDMLNSQGHDAVSFCVTDPNQPDNPVIYISEGFSRLTGYEYEDVVGRNCRFLQGAQTEGVDTQRIRDAVKAQKDCSVNLLNYKKDGSTFINEFFLTTLRAPTKELAYYIGIQVAVAKSGPGQMPSNPGWVYTLGNHA